MIFYFAWVDSTATTFHPIFARQDEDVFAFELTQAEGDFASLDLTIRNPRVGLLGPGRKQWAWFSYRVDSESSLVPLFFGRIVGVPTGLQDNVVQVSLVARPLDFTDQKIAVAQSMQVAPNYWQGWLSANDLADPDKVLEGYSKLWHIDRLSGVVTASDIITGEDGQLDFGTDTAFYDSVAVTPNGQPLRQVQVAATVQWTQGGSGAFDITSQLARKVGELTPDTAANPSGSTWTFAKEVLNVVGGDNLIDSWPQQGANIGGGWAVGASFAELAGPAPIVPTITSAPAMARMADSFDGGKTFFDDTSGRTLASVRQMFGRTPGFVAQIIDHSNSNQVAFFGVGSGTIDVLWIPIWTVAVHMELAWTAARQRTENISFTINADVQSLLSDPDGADVQQITLGPVDVDNYLPDLRSNVFFGTAQGVEALTAMVAQARAILLSAARAVDITFNVPFSYAASVTLRKSATLSDPRLPGGIAAGKIKSYSISLDGTNGQPQVAITIGCTIGKDGTIEAVPGVPCYVADGYVADGWEYESGEVLVPFPDGPGYSGAFEYGVDDDGVNLYNITPASYIQSLTVTGGVTAQMQAVGITPATDLSGAPLYGTGTEAMDVVNGFKTDIQLFMRPVSGGPFVSTIEPTLTELKIPRLINLEAGDEGVSE